MELQGKLYLCATPIGNLEDITYRVLRTLKEVNPIPVKEAMNQLGMNEGGYRLPLCESSESGRETVRRALEVLR